MRRLAIPAGSFALAALLLCSSCNYDKDTDTSPPIEIPQSYSEGGETEPPSVEREHYAPRDARWWRELNDPTLNALIEQALSTNPSVRAGWARVQQARFIADQVRAARMPQVGAAGTFSTGTQLTPVIGDVRSTQAVGSAPVSYEADVFARRAREHQAAKLDADAVRLDQDALRISISAEVAEAWFDAINAQTELAVLEDQLETDLQFLELVELRYREGLNSAVDVHQQRQRVAGARARLALAVAQTDLTTQRLAVLLGEPPGRDFPVAEASLPELGPTPDIEVPASLLEWRPDIRAAQTRLEAADRRVAAAVGARLPQITLSAAPSYSWLKASSNFSLGGTNDTSTDDTLNGFTWRAGADISVPIFDGLFGRALINTQKAVSDEVVELYAETLLRALFEVESSLTLERQERVRIQHLEEEVKLAGATLAATRDRYRAGLSDFLPVLTALATRQLAELQLVNSRRQLVSYRVQLYRALGGSWPDEFGDPSP